MNERKIGMAVKSLNRWDDIVLALEALSARHAVYGVRDEDYNTDGRAPL